MEEGKGRKVFSISDGAYVRAPERSLGRQRAREHFNLRVHVRGESS